MRGSISAESELGRGATLRLTALRRNRRQQPGAQSQRAQCVAASVSGAIQVGGELVQRFRVAPQLVRRG